MIYRKKHIWQFPWGYPEAFFITAGLLLISILLEWFTSIQNLKMVSFPSNVIIILLFTGFLFYVRFIFPKNPFVKFLSGMPAAISSIIFLGILVIVMGVVKQNHSSISYLDRLGLTTIKTSWMMAFAVIYLLTSLGLTILRRLRKFNLRNTVFLLNHLGIFILVVAAVAGTGDYQKYIMQLQQGQIVYTARDEKGRVVELPLAIRLNRFDVEYHLPKIAMVNLYDTSIMPSEGLALKEVTAGATFQFKKWNIRILKTVPEGIFSDTSFISENKPGAVFGALLEVTDNTNNRQFRQWIHHGSISTHPRLLPLDTSIAIAITNPQPAKFVSHITVYNIKKQITNDSIMVNRPVKTMDFHIYQLSYDSFLGKYSKTSTVELVKDPWLPVIYGSFIMIIAGALGLFFIGNKSKYSV